MLAADAVRLASDTRQQFVLLRAHRLLDEIFTEQDSLTVAGQHLDTPLRWATSCEALFEQALTLLAFARLAVRSEGFQRAHDVLSDSRDILLRLNARPAMDESETLAAVIASRLGIVADEAPNVPHAALPGGLKTRDVAVLRVVAAGMSNQ